MQKLTTSPHVRIFTVCLSVAVGSLLAVIATPASAAAPGTTVVKIYSCPQGTARATAERLRDEFAILPDVRIADDEARAEVIVVAPPEVQARISQRLAQSMGGPAAKPADEAGASPAAELLSPPGRSQTIRLQNTTTEQLEASLWSTLGNRLSAVTGSGPQARRYRLALPAGDSIELVIQPALRQVTVDGPSPAVEGCARLVRILDRPAEGDDRSLRVIPVRDTKMPAIQQAVSAIREGTGAREPGMPMVAMLFQEPKDGPAAPKAGAAAPKRRPLRRPSSTTAASQSPTPKPSPKAEARPEPKDQTGLRGPVTIEIIDPPGVLVLRGDPRDVAQVEKIIEDIEELSKKFRPVIEVVPLHQADSLILSTVVRSLYDEVYLARQGSVSITPLVKPNALLVVGRPENVRR